MIDVLSHLVSWSFGIGLLAGFLLSRLWEVVKVCWLDRRKPLPDGRKRSKWQAVQIDPRWLSGLIAVSFLTWSVITTNSNAANVTKVAEDAKAFAAETRHCQKVLIVAINAGRAITTEYNGQSQEQRNALANWLRTLLDPPADIARLPGDDPVRQRWAIDVTSEYFNHIEQLQKEQAATDASRPPLPDPDCGS